MSKELSLAEKLKEARLPRDMVDIIGRVYEFNAENGNIYVGKITGLEFIPSLNRLVLLANDALVVVPKVGKKFFEYKEGNKSVDGELKLL